MPTFQLPTSPPEPKHIQNARRMYRERFLAFALLERKLCRSEGGLRFVGRIKAIGS